MSKSSEPGLGHQPALDGIRAFAVLAVMLFHAQVSWAVGGYLGVDAFFVLSGFLITTLLLTEWLRRRPTTRARGHIDLVDFYRRRLRRLLPALLVMLLGVAAYAAFIARSSDLTSIRDDAFAALLYIGNWHQVSAPQGYFAQFAAPSPLQHTWSLAVEEQWYLVWPLVIVGLLHIRVRLGGLLRLVVALAIGSALLMAVLYGNGGSLSRVYYGTDTRAQELLIGSALAVAFVRGGFIRSRWARIAAHLAAIAAVVVLLVAWTQIDGSTAWLYRGGFFVLALCVALVILSVIQPDSTPLRRLLSLRPLCWIGAISYGLYLWHWPVYVWLTSARTGIVDETALLALRLAVTFAIATASYYLIEMPIRQQRVRLRPMRVLVPALTGSVAVVFLVASMGATTPIQRAFAPLEQVAAASKRPPPNSSGGALAAAASVPVVGDTFDIQQLPIATPGRLPRVFLGGDSVAVSLGVGLANVAGDRAAVWNRGAFGCGLAVAPYSVDDDPGTSDHCVRYRDTWVSDALDWQSDVVLLLSNVWDTFDREGPNGSTLRFGTPEFDAWYLGQIHGLNQQLAASGAKVVLLTAPCIDTSGYTLGQAGGLWDSFDPSRVPHLNGLFQRAALADPSTLTLLDLGEVVCPAGKPIRQIGGQDIRFDGVHFSTAGSEWASRWLIPRIIAS